MNNAVETIQRVLATDLMDEDLMELPTGGATDEQVAEEESRIGRSLSAQHTALLKRWNGLDLDIVRIAGCSDDSPTTRISEGTQRIEEIPTGGVYIGSDPSGFVFFETQDGAIHSFDHDGGATEPLARDIDDFISRLVFGPDAAEFGDEDWADELREAGLIE